MLKRVTFLLVIAMALLSCKRDAPSEWEVDALFPLAKAHLTVSDLIPDSLLAIDDDGLAILRYDKSLTDFDLDSLVEIPDTLIRQSFVVPAPTPDFDFDPGQAIPLPISSEEGINVPNAELREIDAGSGTMIYTINNYIDGPLLVTFSLPGVTKEGVFFTIEQVLPPAVGVDPETFSGEVDLSGYHFDLTGESGTESNTVETSLSVIVDPAHNEAVTVGGNDSLAIDIEFISPSILYALGYFGQHEYAVEDTISLDVMSGIIDGNLDVGEVNFSLDIDNYVGADARFQIQTLASSNSSDNTVVELSNPDLLDVVNITRALDAGYQVIPTNYNIQLDEMNSNIDEFIENLPNEVIYDIDVEVNPLGNVSDGNDFIYTDFPLDAHLIIEMPLCVNIENLVIQDTLEITSDEDVDVSGKIFVYAENGFPFEAEVHLSLIDDSGEILADFITAPLLSSGFYDPDSEITIPQSSILEATISEGESVLFHTDNQLVLRIEFNTSGSEQVKLKADHFIDIKVVADVTGKVGFN